MLLFIPNYTQTLS